MSWYISIFWDAYICIYIYQYSLVVSTPLTNMSSSVGMMKFPMDNEKPGSKPQTSSYCKLHHYTSPFFF